MKKKIGRNNGGDLPVGRLRVIEDFLPPPDKLLPAQKLVKVTLSLDRGSIRFFKMQAARLGTQYQKMIREVVRGYVQHYSHRKEGSLRHSIS